MLDIERPLCVCVAGPNGSGKSTLAKTLKFLPPISHWIDPDEVTATLQVSDTETRERRAFINSRNARVEYAIHQQSFGFETVLSHPSNADFLQALTLVGYRVHLYFVCTSDPSTNIQRIKNRVAFGGHSVPDDKVIDRWHASQRVLMGCMRMRTIERIVLFDNSRIDLPGSVFAEIKNERGRCSIRIMYNESHLSAWVKDAINACRRGIYHNDTPISDSFNVSELSKDETYRISFLSRYRLVL